MIEADDDQLDARLRAIFAAVDLPPDDGGFVACVMHRIRRRVIVRHAVLGAAILLGVAVAAMPLAELATVSGTWLASRAVIWRMSDPADLSLVWSAGVVLAGLCLGAYRWLAR